MPALKYWDAGSNQYVLLMPGAPTTFPLIYTQTLSAPTVVSSPYQVNHNLGTTTPLVQAYDAVTGQLVMVAITVANSNSIQVSVSANMPNNINVVVVGTAQSPVPVSPADLANKSYVDARTPNLPAPITSGSGVQSFTDVLGDVWVAANGVAGGVWKRARDVLNCRVYRTAAYTFPTTAANMPWDTVFRDPYNLFSGANFTAVCPVAGLYHMETQICVTYTAANQFLAVVGVGMTLRSNRYSGAAQNTYWTFSDTQYVAAAANIGLTANTSVALAMIVGSADSFYTLTYVGTG